MVPAAALLVLLGPRIGVLLFNYGNSTFEDARYLGVVVSFFALGLPAFSAYYVLLRGYYALEDTRTPFTINVGLNLVNVALALSITAALPPDRQVAGLAVAYSVAYWLALGVSWLVLRGRLGGLETYRVVRTAVRVSIATGIALAIGFGLVASGLVADGSQLTPLTALVSTAVIGVGVRGGVPPGGPPAAGARARCDRRPGAPAAAEALTAAQVRPALCRTPGHEGAG